MTVEPTAFVDWTIKTRAEPKGFIFIFRHASLSELAAGEAPRQTAIAMTPEQASLLSEDLARNIWQFQRERKPDA